MTRLRAIAVLCTALLIMGTGFLLWGNGPPGAPANPSGFLKLSGEEVNPAAPAPIRAEQSIRREGVPNTVGRILVAVRCQDEVVPGALVVASSAAGRVTGVTEHTGIAALSIGSSRQSQGIIQVTADGFLDYIQSYRFKGDAIQVELARGGREIEGAVTLSDGTAPPEGLEVVAWPGSVRSPHWLISDGGGLRASLDASGRFAFRNVGREGVMVLGVSGPGWTSRKLLEVDLSMSQLPSLQLIACRVHGVLLEARDQTGSEPGPCAFAHLAYRPGNAEFDCLSPRPSTDWALAGLLRELQRHNPRDNWANSLLALKGPGRLAQVGAEVYYDIPGYEKALAEVWLPPVSESLPIWQVHLTRKAWRLVDLHIRYVPNWGSSDIDLKGRPLYELQVCQSTGDSEPLWRCYRDALVDEVITGIPEGSYSIRLVRSGSPRKWLPAEGPSIALGASHPNTVTFDLARFCGLEIKVPGDPPLQPARDIQIGRRVYRFASGPYLLWGLPPGEVKIKVKETTETVVLEAGKTTVVELTR